MSCVLAAIESPGAIALIGAIAGISGGALGALVGGWSTYRIQERGHVIQRRRDLRAELRERESELAQVRGIARVWRTKLDDLRHLLDRRALVKEPMWWPPEADPDTSIPSDDMKAVAAELTHDQWYTVDVALSSVKSVFLLRDAMVSDAESAFLEMTEDNVEHLKKQVLLIEQAMEVLDELSERRPTIPSDP